MLLPIAPPTAAIIADGDVLAATSTVLGVGAAAVAVVAVVVGHYH
jgi:hypothetical protein